jgi:hypothetical protein
LSAYFVFIVSMAEWRKPRSFYLADRLKPATLKNHRQRVPSRMWWAK